jgi:uncharacterized protein (DUF58 family)
VHTTPLVELGFLMTVVLSPLLFIIWTVSDRAITVRQWAVLTPILLMGSAFMGMYAVSLLAGLILVVLGIAWLLHPLILSDVSYSRMVRPTHVFPGERAEAAWTLINNKPLPISWLRWRETLPRTRHAIRESDGLTYPGVEPPLGFDGGDQVVDHVAALRSYDQIHHTQPIIANRRGYYRFLRAHCTASDVFGFFNVEREFDDDLALTVYPQVRVHDPIEPEIRGLLGDWRRRNSLLEDPIWYRGDRDYRSTDPMRSIDWRASARTNNLQVKTFEPTTHPKLMIVVNLHAFERVSSGWITEHMEDVISMAASIASWASELGYEVGVHSNGALPGSHTPFRILPSAGNDQLFAILEYLARITLVISRPIEETLEDVKDLPYGTSVMLCSNVVTQGLLTSLHQQWRGRHIALILVDNKTKVVVPGVPVVYTGFKDAA